MASDTDVTPTPRPEAPSESPASASPASPATAAAPPAEPAEPAADTGAAQEPAASSPPTKPPRAWSLPKAPNAGKLIDELCRLALKAVTGLAAAIAGIARIAARTITQIGRGIEQIPSGIRLLSVLGILMLIGVVGSVALAGTGALICAVVVVPISSIAVGALGHRWYTRHGGEQAHAVQPGRQDVTSPDLALSMTYVDAKLTLALNTFGSERHQQAVIALFQAKTAVELALGTDQDPAHPLDTPVSVDAYRLRPRIQVGSASKTPMAERNTLAAS